MPKRTTKNQTQTIDLHLGKKLRLARMLRGLSMQNLGEQINVSHQQILKYEKASNRMSAALLHQISKVLEVKIQDFFHGLDKP